MKPVLLFLLLAYIQTASAQNLPSLISTKNINATFSIVAFDPQAQEWGIAVATNNIYVGNSTVYIQPGLGAFSVIAETEPAYAFNGFERLHQGTTISDAIEFTRKADPESYLRQVSGIDSLGNGYAFTGSTWKYQKGFAGHLIGKGYVVMGNQLGDSVLVNMSDAFLKAKGALSQRLLAALIAGQHAGGQITGKQSAALVVRGTRNEWFNNIDLRVDDSKDPFGDLQRLLNYHYGRIKLNQAIGAIKMGNTQRGKDLLADAERMTKGWNGFMGKLAIAHLLLHEQAKAVAIIHDAMKENPKWAENLPFFYLLRDEPGMSGLIEEKRFGEKDWIAALSLPEQLNRNADWAALATTALQIFPLSSYLNYQLGQALHAQGKDPQAKVALQKAIKLDPANAEAASLLTSLSRL